MQKPGKVKFSPRGYRSFVTNCGIKDSSLDLGIIFSEVPATAAAVFTRNKIPGKPVLVGRKHVKNGRMQAVVVNSKNSNVATGKEGYQKSLAICEKLAREMDIKTADVFPSSTGVIGRPLPVEKITSALSHLKIKLKPADFNAFATAIMTTDTFPKMVSAKVGNAVIVGVAKGSGMIEPNMATMLSYFFTDAAIPAAKLKKMLYRAVEPNFNSLSVDSDTSTSDTVLIMANGLAGEVDENAFQQTFNALAEQLTRLLARDGEGATKLFIVDVKNARNDAEARRIGKSIINSPLVKTAIYKGDPNWGRIFMAVGKTPGVKIKEEKIRLLWGHPPKEYGNEQLKQLNQFLKKSEEIHLTVDLGVGKGAWRVFGCDMTEEYVKINAYYTT